MCKFELSQERIEFLKKEYSENNLIQKVLETEKNGVLPVK